MTSDLPGILVLWLQCDASATTPSLNSIDAKGIKRRDKQSVRRQGSTCRARLCSPSILESATEVHEARCTHGVIQDCI